MKKGEIIELPSISNDEDSILIKRSVVFLMKSKELSDFINSLPLSRADNDKLVGLMVEVTKQIEMDAFLQGIALGANVSDV